jgi:hypothetical protein
MLPFGKTQKRKIALQRRSVTRSQFNSRTCRGQNCPRCRHVPPHRGLSPRRNPHSCGTAYVPPPRFRALALFGRRPPERVVGIVGAGVRKPAQKRPHAVQQATSSQPRFHWNGYSDRLCWRAGDHECDAGSSSRGSGARPRTGVDPVNKAMSRDRMSKSQSGILSLPNAHATGISKRCRCPWRKTGLMRRRGEHAFAA